MKILSHPLPKLGLDFKIFPHYYSASPTRLTPLLRSGENLSQLIFLIAAGADMAAHDLLSGALLSFVSA